jgi:peptide chain release factor 2
MAENGFWDNQEKAQVLVNELRRLNAGLKPIAELISAADDIQVLIEFAEADPSEESIGELVSTVESTQAKFNEVELQTMLAAPEDPYPAYVAIQAGEGGTDASDWAAMLLRMYQRWAEDKGFASELLEISEAEEAGIRSATIAIRGDFVYGLLKGETGIHRLIRISPFDSAGRRQTSFAAVDVSPEVEDDVNIEIDWDKDVREDIFRASGAGGQHVNKTSSAIRLTHLPSNTVVQCQNERSQHKNRALAQKMLKAKLFKIEVNRRDAEQAAKRGQKSKIGFGGETIRNYVLNPESYVKDTRSGLKVGNPQPVLDGEIDEFLEAYLRWLLDSGGK